MAFVPGLKHQKEIQIMGTLFNHQVNIQLMYKVLDNIWQANMMVNSSTNRKHLHMKVLANIMKVLHKMLHKMLANIMKVLMKVLANMQQQLTLVQNHLQQQLTLVQNHLQQQLNVTTHLDL